MHETEQLCKLLEKQLSKVGMQNDLSTQDLDNVYKAAKTIYYIEVTKAMKEHEELSDEYLGNSGDMEYLRNKWRMNPSSRSYRRSSYDRAPMDNMYARDDERSRMIETLEDMMHNAPTNSEKETIQRCINKMVNY